MPLHSRSNTIFNTLWAKVVKAGGTLLHSGREAATLAFMPRIFRVFLIALSISVAFLAGLYFGGHYYRLSFAVGMLPDPVRTALFPGDDLLQLEREIEGILQENFFRPVDRAMLENGAIEGMVQSLDDPYTAYFTPEDFRRYREHANGTFVGVGVIIEPKDSQLTVVSPIENSPASAAGIQAGDMIITINGDPVAGKSAEEAAALIRGEEGTTVVLGIRRGDSSLEFSLVRRAIELPVVVDRMVEHNGKKIGYVRLEQFSVDTGAKVKGSVDRLVGDGAEGIIFDLRDNGGGILDEAVNVTSVFIENGTIVSVVSRDEKQSVYEARGDANESIPMVVLINGYSASASEIVAGAIKDNGRGQLVGEKTFGKGVVQLINPLSNGGAIKFTSGVYYTPDGVNINEVGIEPDVPVAADEATGADEVLERGLALLAP